jgi:hypothetical protein
MSDHLTLALVTGLVAGVLDVIPMIARHLSGRSCLAAFLLYFFATLMIFYSDLPYLPWWADGMGVTMMMAIPVLLTLVGKDRKSGPIIVLNALVLGFLISVAERFI